ncbi:hypothetical protein [Mangrovibacterium lignilyticum]|uniref:hypothetical protein n=1 Tax=Mangrovibacterium lignilyticum TaxID=2668052 RepID=UPI0013D06056|nr:hypothetical protein [Mangrovibacterium lignilyticum]
MKTTIGILTVILVVAFGVQTNAQKQQRNSCINGISNLTEDQKTSIGELETTFQKQMADYRTERQATTDLDAKASIRAKMLATRTSHREQVNTLLNADQQKEYAAWQDARQQRGNKGNAVGPQGKQGKGKGKGQCNGQSRSGKGRGTCRANS